MRKILVIGLTGQMGGTENYIYNLIKLFDLSNYTFDFLVIQDGNRTPYENEINTLIADGSNHFYYCPNMKKDYVGGRKWLKEFYDSHSYDLIYMNATTAARTAYCRYAISHYHIPMIMHSHRSDGKRINHFLYKSYSYRHSSFKLACSGNAAEWMYGKNCKEAIIIPNGIDTNRFQYSDVKRAAIRKQFHYSEHDIVLGHVGRFSEEKNHKFLVNLCSRLDARYKFLCIGDGPLKPEIQQMIEEKGLIDRFTLLPVRKDVNELYSAMDGFVMPSYNEGLPIVSVEAQCSGLICFFSNTVSRETNLSGKCHYLALNNVEEWERNIASAELKRFDGVDVIKQSGFDMESTAGYIAELFDAAISSDV